MDKKFVYNRKKDLHPVEQLGFVDLRESFVNGVIPADVSSDTLEFNGVEDPDTIMHRGSDVFENIRNREVVVAARAASAAKQSDTTPSGGNE